MFMKLLFILSLLLLIPGVYAAQYIAPTDPLMSFFTASSTESGVLSDGDDLGNTTIVFFYHDVYGRAMSFKINSTQDLDLRGLKIYTSDEKSVIDKGASNIGLYTIYLPQSNNGKGVYLCPDAMSFDSVNKQCNNAVKLSGPFPQINGFLVAEIKNITNSVYSVSGIQSGGIGLLDENTGSGSTGGGQTDSKPSIETISPQQGEKAAHPVFRCQATDDKELKLLELYSDISGTMQLTHRKVTDRTESLLEFTPIGLAEGNYTFYCKAIDSTLQESQSEVISFEVVSQKPIVCVERWGCSPWTPLKCEGGERTRACSDRNQCDTVENKPIETQSCKETCVEDWVCSDWSEGQCGFRSCEDKRLCNNQEEKIPRPEEYIECGSFSNSNQIYIVVVVVILAVIAVLTIYRRRKPVEEA